MRVLPRVVAERLGHSTPSLVMNTYGDVDSGAPDGLRASTRHRAKPKRLNGIVYDRPAVVAIGSGVVQSVHVAGEPAQFAHSIVTR